MFAQSKHPGQPAPDTYAAHLAFVALLIAYAAAIVLLGDGRALPHPMDQGFVYIDLGIRRSPSGHWVFQYPRLHWAGGITGSLLVGIYKLVVPTTVETLNHHVKLLVGLLYLGSAYVLALLYIASSVQRIVFLLIVGTAGLHILEPSAEAIAAFYLNMFVISAKLRWPVVIRAGWLVAFALVKSELVVVGAFIAVLAAWIDGQTWKHRLTFLGLFAAGLLALTAPSWYLHGMAGDRGLGALKASYCGGWYLSDPEVCANGFFKPEIRSTLQFILTRPTSYMTFLALAAPFIVLGMAKSLGASLIALPVLSYRLRGARLAHDDLRLAAVLVVAVVSSALIGWAVGHMFPRYMTRVYPLMYVTLLVLWSYRLERDDGSLLSSRVLAAVFVGVVVIQNVWRLPSYFAMPHNF